MDKKTKGGIGAVVAALIYGGAQILDMESRIGALEDLHPELDAPVAPEAAQEPAEPEPTEEPGDEPENTPEAAEEPAEAEAETAEE